MPHVAKSRLLILALCALAPASFPVLAADKVEIKKCKDADGKWHYGDNAADECARSKITVIDDRGLKLEELKAPPTRDELERRKAEEAAAREAEEKAAEEKRQRDRILSIYDSEEAILRARDERVSHVDRQVLTYEDMLGRLRQRLGKAREQGAKKEAIEQLEADAGAYEKAIAGARRQREEIMTRYANDLEAYRALTAPRR